jgi:ABC-type antimicrobial peptide transport system permease subunit
LGKTITQVYARELREVVIAAVFSEPPMNSSFYRPDGSAYMNFENFGDEFYPSDEDDWNRECAMFVQISDPSRIAGVLQRLQHYRENNNRSREHFQISEFVLDPFNTMAHDDRENDTRSMTRAAPPLSAIISTMIMSVLLLLIACFNLTNTSIAISSRRLKEIGMRKVMGSLRSQLIIQFIGETTFVCLIAMVAGMGLADILIAGWNQMTANNIYLTPDYLNSPVFLLFMVALLVFMGILAGSYPALYISAFRPINILKGKLKLGGMNPFTRILLGLQFTFSLISMVSAIGFLQNARYQQEYNLGFDAKGSVMAWINDENEFNTYRNSLQRNPQIVSMAGTRNGIFSKQIQEVVKYETQKMEVDVIEVGDGYLNTLGFGLVEGRDFIKDSESDRYEAVIVTRKMADLFGWDSAVGKEILMGDTAKYYVAGVVEDILTQGLWKEMDPLLIRYVLPEDYTQIVVSTAPENAAAVNNFMNQQWNEVFPNRLYNGYMLASVLQQATTLNMSIVYGYSFLGAIALLLSVTGLYTLVSLNMIRRMKEIGIRKIVGASVASITRTVNREFIFILLVASVLGAWAGYTWCNTILASIWRYHQEVSITTFSLAVALLVGASLVTIGYKVFSLANVNPVETLRDE